jgi:methionyl-tRNA synthetase
MAKDILKFHAVIWPALLMASGYELPRHLFIHGYLLMGGQKMSKTRGNVLDPFEVMDKYGVDAFRFYCFREVTFGQDGVISMEGFESRYNAELANELGNLLSRTVAMVTKYCSGKVPEPSTGESSFAVQVQQLGIDTGEALANVELTGCLESIWHFVRNLNKHVEDSAPWKLAKDEAKRSQLDDVLYELVEGLRICALLLHPFMPETTIEILRRLGQGNEKEDLALERVEWGGARPGAAVVSGESLFPKLA